MLVTILKFLVMWTMISIALALIIGPVMRWGLNSEPSEIPPLPHDSILGNHPRRVS
jgi:hypothetical protein